jgi:chromosome segregation ATPase
MFDNLKRISELKEEVKTLNESLVQAREDRDTAEINLNRSRTDHRVEIADLENSHQVEVNRLENDLEVSEKSVPIKVAKEVAQEKRDLKVKTEKQDREHADRMKKLEAEHAAKIAKCDRDLETDKASYRKYLRSEVNSKMETLEKDNKRLFEENVKLSSTVKELENVNGRLEAEVESLTESVGSLADNLGTLSTKIAEGLVKAVPTITADFETPVLPENHVHIEAPGAAKGGNQGGGNKEQKN